MFGGYFIKCDTSLDTQGENVSLTGTGGGTYQQSTSRACHGITLFGSEAMQQIF